MFLSTGTPNMTGWGWNWLNVIVTSGKITKTEWNKSWFMSHIYKSHYQNFGLHAQIFGWGFRSSFWRTISGEKKCFHIFLIKSSDLGSINTFLSLVNDLCFLPSTCFLVCCNFPLKTKKWRYLECYVSNEAESSQKRVFNGSIQLGELKAVKNWEEGCHTSSWNFWTTAKPQQVQTGHFTYKCRQRKNTLGVWIRITVEVRSLKRFVGWTE